MTTDPGTPDPTTTTVLERAGEVRERIRAARAATTDAAELAGDVLPQLALWPVVRALSVAHRALGEAMSAAGARDVGAAHLLELAGTGGPARVLCSCGLTFTRDGWRAHRGSPAGAAHTLAGQLTLAPADPAARARVIRALYTEAEDDTTSTDTTSTDTTSTDTDTTSTDTTSTDTTSTTTEPTSTTRTR